jgi:predicted Zn-dependent protease
VALPGGRIYLFNGLIQFAEGPNEVLGVLAHEMAHVQERHVLENLLRHSGFQIIVSSLGAGGSFAQYGQVLLQRSYSREDEAGADVLGTQALNRAGLPSEGMVTFFRRLRDRRGSDSFLPDIASTHPSTDERILRMKKVTRSGTPVLTEGEWKILQSFCEKGTDES